jgi:hypothetical protein
MRPLRARSLSVGALAILGLAVALSAVATPPRQQLIQATTSEIALTLAPVQSSVHFEVDSTLRISHPLAGSAFREDVNGNCCGMALLGCVPVLQVPVSTQTS